MAWYIPLWCNYLDLVTVSTRCTGCVNMFNHRQVEVYHRSLTCDVKNTIANKKGEFSESLNVVGYDADKKVVIVVEGDKVQEYSRQAFTQLIANTHSPVRYLNILANVLLPHTQYVTKEATIQINNQLLLKYRRLPVTCIEAVMQNLYAVHKKITAFGIRDKEQIAEQYTKACEATGVLTQYSRSVFDYHALYEAIFRFMIETCTSDISVTHGLSFVTEDLALATPNVAVAGKGVGNGIFGFHAITTRFPDAPIVINYIRVTTNTNCVPSSPNLYLYRQDISPKPLPSLSVIGFFEGLWFAPMQVKGFVSLRQIRCTIIDLSNITLVAGCTPADDIVEVNCTRVSYLTKLILPQLGAEVRVLKLRLIECTEVPEVYLSTGVKATLSWREIRADGRLAEGSALNWREMQACSMIVTREAAICRVV